MYSNFLECSIGGGGGGGGYFMLSLSSILYSLWYVVESVFYTVYVKSV